MQCVWCNSGAGMNKNEYFNPNPSDGIYRIDDSTFVEFITTDKNGPKIVNECFICRRKLGIGNK